jgi:hypothetical protein
MRAPAAPFHAALDAYDRSRIKATKENGWRGNRNTADTEHLARWKADPRAEGLWTSTRGIAPSISDAELIQTTLNARRSANGTVARVVGVHGLRPLREVFAERADKLAKLASFAKRLWLLDKAEYLEKEAAGFDQAAAVPDIHPSDHLGLPNQQKFQLSRKAKLRTQNLFMQVMHDYLHRRAAPRARIWTKRFSSSSRR